MNSDLAQMARKFSYASQNILPLLLSALVAIISVAGAGEGHEFGRVMDKKKLGFKKEKVSHFRLYWHDVVSGPNPSAVKVVSPPDNSSRLLFGMVRMIDNALTIGPEITSKLVGRAQGLYAQASQHEIGFLMAMNLAFIEGKYNGSTITVFGRNAVFSTVREMPVIGGSGLFRFARGYVQARTHKFDMSTGDATVEYDIYVMHY